MKKLFLKSAVLILIILVFCSWLLWLKPIKFHNKTNDYVGAMIDKHQRLNTLTSPKLVFAGGSNLAFGLNSEKIQQDLKIPVVNMGLHARLGIDFILNEIEQYSAKGDIIVLSVEYYFPKGSDERLINHAHTVFPQSQKYLSLNKLQQASVISTDIKLYFYQRIKHIQQSLENWNKPVDTLNYYVYSREGFNSYGDLVRHLEMPLSKNLTDRMNIKSIDFQSHIHKMNKFSAEMLRKGVTVYFTYSAFAESEYVKNIEEIHKLEKLLREELAFPVLGKPVDFVYPDNYFFDTVYHLHREGREQRTQKLIKLLHEKLDTLN